MKRPPSKRPPRISHLLPARIEKNHRRGKTTLRSQCNVFIRLMGDLIIDDVDDDALAKFRQRAAQAGYAQKTIDCIASTVRGLWRRHTGTPYHRPPNGVWRTGPDPQTLDNTLLAHYVHMYKPLQLGGKPPTTDHQFRVAIATFGNFLGRPATIDDLTDEKMAAAMTWYSKQKRVKSHATVNKLRTQIVAIWNFLARKRYVQTAPTVRNWPEPERTPRAWLAPELAKLWKACDGVTGNVGKHPANLFWPALVRLAWDSGERRSALFGIQWEDVDLEAGFANFRADVRKGRRKPNLVKLAPDTVERLRRIQQDLGPVFPWPYDDVTIYVRWRAILRRAGLPTGREYMLHCLRRSVASHAEAAGGNATALLLHSSRTVTERYLDPRIAQKPNAVDLLFRPDAVGVARDDDRSGNATNNGKQQAGPAKMRDALAIAMRLEES